MQAMHPPRADARRVLLTQELLAEKRGRLGTALQQLAADLARERRRNRELERELARLRERADRPAGE
jgi:hypothetical protein